MRHLPACCVLLVGLALGWVQSRAALAEVYRQKTRDFTTDGPQNALGLQMAGLAVQTSPWDSGLHQALAWRLQAARQPADARKAFASALALAPADAYLWADYARLLAAQRKFGLEMTAVTRRSNELGPTSAAIQRSNARIGARYWSRGGAELREHWRQSMAFMLRNDRETLLEGVRKQGREHLFCMGPGATLSLERWCKSRSGGR